MGTPRHRRPHPPPVHGQRARPPVGPPFRGCPNSTARAPPTACRLLASSPPWRETNRPGRAPGTSKLPRQPAAFPPAAEKNRRGGMVDGEGWGDYPSRLPRLAVFQSAIARATRGGGVSPHRPLEPHAHSQQPLAAHVRGGRPNAPPSTRHPPPAPGDKTHHHDDSCAAGTVRNRRRRCSTSCAPPNPPPPASGRTAPPTVATSSPRPPLPPRPAAHRQRAGRRPSGGVVVMAPLTGRLPRPRWRGRGGGREGARCLWERKGGGEPCPRGGNGRGSEGGGGHGRWVAWRTPPAGCILVIHLERDHARIASTVWHLAAVTG